MFLRSLDLALSDELSAHLAESFNVMRLPGSSILYDSRISMDLACMLFARERIFSKKVPPWVIHLRADSSPQFGRDYLVIQADIVTYGINFESTNIVKRLMPIQCVGSKASGAHQKLEKLVHSLALESEHVSQLLFAAAVSATISYSNLRGVKTTL